MSYIGRKPTVGNFQICDAISVVNGQAAYTMQVGSVNVSPESANHMLVSLNGILQKPGSSFTVSGSTITFASNLVTGDVIDFIQILGNVLDLGVPSDATVTTAKLADSSVTTAKLNDASVSLAKLTATGTKDATTFLRGDNTFQEVSSDFVFVSTTTISSSVAQVDIDFDYSTYKQIFLFVEGLQATADGNVYARFKISGSINTSSAYASNTIKKYYSGLDSSTYGGQNQSYMYVTNDLGGALYESWSAQMRILLGSGLGMPFIDLTTSYKSAGGNFDQNMGSLTYQNFNQVQGIRLYHSAGNLDTGKIHMYGVK